jgi:hypothetical protein
MHHDDTIIELYFKINIFIFSLVCFSLFFCCYKYDIKVLTIILDYAKKNEILTSNVTIEYILNILVQNLYYIVIFSVLVFIFCMLKFQGVEKLKEYIKMYIYRKINLSINILIFIYIVNIT